MAQASMIVITYSEIERFDGLAYSCNDGRPYIYATNGKVWGKLMHASALFESESVPKGECRFMVLVKREDVKEQAGVAVGIQAITFLDIGRQVLYENDTYLKDVGDCNAWSDRYQGKGGAGRLISCWEGR